MNAVNLLGQLLLENNGILKTNQALSVGVTKPTFLEYVRKTGMEKVGTGIYMFPNAWKDDMYLLHLKCKQAVFSHETALYLHELTDRDPMVYSITVKTGYNPTRLQKDGTRVYTIKKELHDLGLMTIKTNFNNTVPVYNMERTLCDIMRNRNKIDFQVFQDSLKNYTKNRNKNLQLLMEYAKIFRVEKIMREYLGVLL